MSWPWKRFETLYSAHTKRIAVEEATQIRNAMIAGLWANTNLDDEKNTRSLALEQIEESHREAIAHIYAYDSLEEQEPDILKTHPLFTAMKLED